MMMTGIYITPNAKADSQELQQGISPANTQPIYKTKGSWAFYYDPCSVYGLDITNVKHDGVEVLSHAYIAGIRLERSDHTIFRLDLFNANSCTYWTQESSTFFLVESVFNFNNVDGQGLRVQYRPRFTVNENTPYYDDSLSFLHSEMTNAYFFESSWKMIWFGNYNKIPMRYNNGVWSSIYIEDQVTAMPGLHQGIKFLKSGTSAYAVAFYTDSSCPATSCWWGVYFWPLEDNYLDMNNDQNEGVYDTGDIGTYVITKLNPPPGAYVSASCSFGVHT